MVIWGETSASAHCISPSASAPQLTASAPQPAAQVCANATQRAMQRSNGCKHENPTRSEECPPRKRDTKDTLLISLNAASSNKIQLSDPFFFSSTRQFNMWPDISLATHWYYQDLRSNLVFYTFNIGPLTLSTLAYYPHICRHFVLLLLFSVLLRL